MDRTGRGLMLYDVLHAIAVIVICVGAAVFLHLRAGSEPPDNPGAAAQLTGPAAAKPVHATKADPE